VKPIKRKNFLTIRKIINIVIYIATIGVGIAFWIVFRVIFTRITTIYASPLSIVVSIIAPLILFAIFIWLLTLVILYLKNWKLRLLLYAILAIAYIPANWLGLVNIVSFLGLFLSLILFDKMYRMDIANQKKQMLGRTVISAGVLPITIFSVTISLFYFPIYAHNTTKTLSSLSALSRSTISNLGYFYFIQIFLIVSTSLSSLAVGVTTKILNSYLKIKLT